jgi:hypothetical protein
MPTQEQIDAFINDYGALRDKHKLDFISVPRFVPTERGTWEIVIAPQVASIEGPLKSPDEFIPGN